ncbi:MAG: 3-deoxy-manno-octulosonate cytidylyltransferase [Alphaproteobacteria bacterium]|nr:3-deoxy-manno-octulosonate cytidylyltransferase [Alphaproteobacteria bacterium]
MSLRIIIPARYGSTRLPGKPLALISGVALLQRVWSIAVSAIGRDGVFVTTDDERVSEFCSSFGASCIMTSPDIQNGTQRVHAALAQLPADVDKVINLQGDAVLTPPWVINAMIEAMANPEEVGIFTPAVRMSKSDYEALRKAKAAGEVGGTTVTFDVNHNALYFSKSIIPFVREAGDVLPVFRHIGLYGYTRDALAKMVALPPSVLEQTEKLEQLRALENGMKIRVVPVDYKGRSHVGVDSENDRLRAEKLILAEGELLPVYDGSYRYGS